MSYQLQRNETPGESVRRICRRQVELGLAIVAGEKETADTPVHERTSISRKRGQLCALCAGKSDAACSSDRTIACAMSVG